MAELWIKSIEEILSVPKDDLEAHFVLELKKYDKVTTNRIIESFDSLIKQGYQVSLSIYAYQRNFNAQEIALFVVFEKQLKEMGVPLYFSNTHKATYTLKELIHADEVMDEFINRLKESSLSPLEKFLVIHNHLTDKTYSDDKDRPFVSRDILSVMNGDKIVCEGFAELVEYYCENIGIKSFIQELIVADEKGRDNHVNNLILINDDKYHIHGLYYVDATWDSYKDGEPGKSYTFCLIPLHDVKHIKIGIELYQPYPIFYPEYPGRSVSLTDSMYQVLLGSNNYYGDDYRFEYEPGFLETEFGLKEMVDETYDMAINLLKTRGKEVAHQLIETLKEMGANEELYREPSVPQGASLPYVFAILLFHDKNLDKAKRIISYMIKHEGYLRNEFDSPYLPRSGIDNVYETLEAIANFDFKEINISYEEFDRLLFETRKSDFYRYLTLQFLWNVVEKVRLGRTLFLATKIIREQYPIGEPIPLATFTRALKEVYRFNGLNEKEIDPLLETSLAKSKKGAQISYDDEAINCWKKAI